MPKQAPTSKTALVGSGRAVGAGATARGTKTRIKVDPKVYAAIAEAGESQPVRVLVKLDTKTLGFAQLPASNAPDNPRSRAFATAVEDVLRSAAVRAAASRGKSAPTTKVTPAAKIVSAAANLGVATVDAPRKVTESLLQDVSLQGVKLG